MAGVMKPYIVRQGDYLAKLAFVHGFDADTVWQDPKNEELRKLRPDPDVLAPGDILCIPDKGEEPLPIEKGTVNHYAAEVPRVEVTVVFQEADGTPIGNEPCEVRGVPEGSTPLPNSTEDTGRLSLEVPVLTHKVEVYFPRRNDVYWIGVGDMDPHAEGSGLRKRLENLGYLVPRPWNTDADAFAEGLRRFQQDQGLEATGTIDDATRKALEDAHGA